MSGRAGVPRASAVFRDSLLALCSIALTALPAKAETLVEQCERIWRLLDELDPARDAKSRACAADALSEEGWSAVAAIPQLYDAMLSPDPAVQQAGQSAVGKVERGLVVGAKACLGEEAAKAVPDPIGDRALALFVERLRSADTEQRLRATRGMAMLLGADALQRHPWALRHNRAKGLLPLVGPIRPDTLDLAADALARVLADPSPYVRGHAAMAFAALDQRARGALPNLLRALESESDTQARHLIVVAISWSRARDETAVAPLLRVLDGAPERTQLVALHALSEIRPLPEAAGEPIRRFFFSASDTVAEVALTALENAFRDRDELLKGALAVAVLQAKSAGTRKLAAERLRGSSAGPGSALQELVRGLQAADADVRTRAFEALVSLGKAASPAAPLLRRVVENPDLPPEVQSAAERILAGLHDE